MKHLKLLLLATSATLLAFPSCATTKGFGQDLQKAGQKLEQRADATGGAAPSSAPSAY